MKFDFDVVVVQYRSLPLPRDFARDFKLHGKTRLTVIQNDLSLHPEQMCWGHLDWPIRFANPGDNLGWVKGANVGLALSTAPYVVLMNDDVEVKTDGWLQKLRNAFNRTSEAPEPGYRVAAASSYARPGTHQFHSQGGWPTGGSYLIEPRLSLGGWGIGYLPLSFWCVMFSREALTEVGYLDERFNDGYGGDDDDWQARAHLAGWKLAVCPEVEVLHEGGASFGKGGAEKARLQERNVELLREKWKGVLDG